MKQTTRGRRHFLKGTLAGGTLASVPVLARSATTTTVTTPTAAPAAPAPAPAYGFLTQDEAAFVEALVDHMVPACEHCGKGSELGINLYIDRALAGGWGQGDRLYLQGPWRHGTPSQGYQLALTPAQLYRAGIAAVDAHARQTYGARFDALAPAQRETLLQELERGRVVFDSGLPSATVFGLFYQTVVEGMFADPLHGGNAGKAVWKMMGFPGAVATHARNISAYKDKPFDGPTFSIADVS